MTIDSIRKRISEIDAMFENAKCWGSWMAEASGERRELVRRAAILGETIPDRHLLMAGGRVIEN